VDGAADIVRMLRKMMELRMEGDNVRSKMRIINDRDEGMS
jgi:hypothetical protein